MVLKILTYGDPRLLKVGEPVKVFDYKLKKIADSMIETMYDTHGMGLAAQQVGYFIRIFVMDLRGAGAIEHCFYDGKCLPLDLFNPMVLVNPEVEPITDEFTYEYEGCISFPGMRADILRADAARIKFQDLQGAWHILECSGYAGHCLQHESDHLDGILFTERMETSVYNKVLPKLKKIKRNTRAALKKEAKQKKSNLLCTSQ